jgi:ATP-dependent Clp protease adaptor protein ClpS
MSTASTEQTAVTAPPPPAKAEPKARPRPKPRRQPPYAVILHNDPYNTFEHVIRVLRRVFGYSNSKAERLTMRAHRTGKSLVWAGMREQAEFKAQRIAACGPDPIQLAMEKPVRPLRATVEPVPGH